MVKMARKIGDVAIALIILSFVLTGLTAFIIGADNSSGVDSGSVIDRLSNSEGELSSDISGFKTTFINKIDNTSSFEPEENVAIEKQLGGGLGILNLLSKNIVVNFFNSISDTVPGASYVLGFLSLLIAVTIALLFIRAWLGETKV